MSATVIPLRWTAGAFSSVRLGALTGAAERAVESTDLDSALALLDAVIVESRDGAHAADLATPDRDRVMAALLGSLAGDLIESTVPCSSCGEVFELSFSLSALIEHRSGSEQPDAKQVDTGRWVIAGTAFRFPNAHDERMARHSSDPARVLAERCVGLDESFVDRAQLAMVEEAMAAMGPVLATEIGGDCPDCGRAHAVTFDVQRYTLSLIQLGHDRLLHDVHVIATSYGWSRAEILGLERDERRHYVDLISSRRRVGARP